MNSSLFSVLPSFRLIICPFLSSPEAQLSFPRSNNPVILRKFLRSSTPSRNFIKASSSSTPATPSSWKLFFRAFEDSAAAAVFLAAAISFAGKTPAARADPTPPVALAEQLSKSTELPKFLKSSPDSDSVESIKQLLQTKLENQEYQEALTILDRIVSAKPDEIEWKFLLARLLSELGDTQGACQVFEELLNMSPFTFEALFEYCLLMYPYGDDVGPLLSWLEEALKGAEGESTAEEVRDLRLIMAQVKFLQKDVEGALRRYQDLSKEDPNDIRPYFCQGVIYSLLNRNEEARGKFSKYRELSPRKVDVDWYLWTSLSRMKLFGRDESK